MKKYKYFIASFALLLILPSLSIASVKTATQGSVLGDYTSSEREEISKIVTKIGTCTSLSTNDQKVSCLSEVLVSLTKILLNRTVNNNHDNNKYYENNDDKNINKNNGGIEIRSLSANQAKAGDVVNIYGYNFTALPGDMNVCFKDGPYAKYTCIKPTSVTNNVVTFSIQKQSMFWSSFAVNKINTTKIFLRREGSSSTAESNELEFNIDTRISNESSDSINATITSLSANQAKYGDTVKIYGRNFNKLSSEFMVCFEVDGRIENSCISYASRIDNMIEFTFKNVLYSYFGTNKIFSTNLFLRDGDVRSNKIEFNIDGRVISDPADNTMSTSQYEWKETFYGFEKDPITLKFPIFKDSLLMGFRPIITNIQESDLVDYGNIKCAAGQSKSLITINGETSCKTYSQSSAGTTNVAYILKRHSSEGDYYFKINYIFNDVDYCNSNPNSSYCIYVKNNFNKILELIDQSVKSLSLG